MLPLLAIVAVALVGCGGPTEPINVVLITLDGLRSDHLPMFGYSRDTAPTLARLAESGALFDRVIPAGCSTKASLTSLYTGLGYAGHGRLRRGDVLSERHVTLAERFREAGYRTSGLVSTPHVAAQFQYNQGFDLYRDKLHDAKRMRPALGTFFDQLEEEPFFLYVHMKEPHPPWEAPTPWLETETESESFFDQGCGYVPGLAQFEAVDEPTRHGLIAKYDGEILAADQLIGLLVDKLEDRGLLERTVIGVGTDHGLELLEHYSASHGYSPFEQVVRTFFLLWRGDKDLGGRRSSVQARIFDIGPTLMAAAGLAPPQDIDGLDLMADSDRLPQTAFTVCYNAAVARRGDMKLIRFRQVGRKRLPPGIENRAYLYDLASDPMETTDVADLHPMIFDALQQELRRHLHRARVEIEGSERLEDDEIDSDVRQRLEALGYID